MRKLAILAALTACLANIGIATAPAGAVALAGAVRATPRFTNLHDVELCDSDGSGLCMNGFDGENGAVKSFPLTPGDAQDVSVTQLSNCGGTVTDVPACPFLAGLGLNSKFQGDPIVGITLDANGFGFRAQPNDGSMYESSGGPGMVWVLDGNTYINVAISSGVGSAEYACDDGHSGHQMFVITKLTANCLWGAVHGS